MSCFLLTRQFWKLTVLGNVAARTLRGDIVFLPSPPTLALARGTLRRVLVATASTPFVLERCMDVHAILAHTDIMGMRMTRLEEFFGFRILTFSAHMWK